MRRKAILALMVAMAFVLNVMVAYADMNGMDNGKKKPAYSEGSKSMKPGMAGSHGKMTGKKMSHHKMMGHKAGRAYSKSAMKRHRHHKKHMMHKPMKSSKDKSMQRKNY